MKILPSLTKPWSDLVWYILIILIFIALVSTSCYSLIQQQKRFLLDEKQKELATIADLKTAQLVQWRKERFTEGASIRANGLLACRIEDFIAGKDTAKVHQEFKRWMANLIDLGEYSNGILFSPEGKILSSAAEIGKPPTQHYFDLVAEAAREHELILSDFHKDSSSDPYELNFTIPIMNFDGAHSRCIAVLVLDLNPAKRFYPLIQSWPTASPTAETLLVKREGNSVLFLNELRSREKTSTPFLRPLTSLNMPAVRAALGQEGSFEGVDYRDIAVLCAIRVIPGTRWGMVAKIDTSEVMAPLSKSIVIVTFVGAIVIIAMILGLFLWGSRRKTETLRKLFIIEQKHNLELKKSEDSLERQILQRTNDLSDINQLLRNEISEREQLEQQLLRSKRLEAIGQIAGGVAHEVRNPLNAILTITEALFRENEIASNPEYEPYILHIRSQVNRLVMLMNDLLDLGRTLPSASFHPITLYDVCRDTVNLWKATGLSKNKQGFLISDDDDQSIQVFADAHKLQQVFFNLLENAGHHSPIGSKIVMKLTLDSTGLQDGSAVVQVIDQGTGIPENKLPHVFDPFYTDRKGGTGLGLALVKHFIENMGGTAQIWNNSPPPGCTVEIRIPLYRKEL